MFETDEQNVPKTVGEEKAYNFTNGGVTLGVTPIFRKRLAKPTSVGRAGCRKTGRLFVVDGGMLSEMESVKRRRPRGISIVALLMIVFGIAEVHYCQPNLPSTSNVNLRENRVTPL